MDADVLINRPDLTRERLERTRALMDENAEGALVEGYEYLIPRLSLPDLNNRHVLAAAIEAEAEIIVTWNLRDFPSPVLAPYEITTQTPDDFLCALFDQTPNTVTEAVRNQRVQLRNPTRTVSEFLSTLEANQLWHFVARLVPHTNSL